MTRVVVFKNPGHRRRKDGKRRLAGGCLPGADCAVRAIAARLESCFDGGPGAHETSEPELRRRSDFDNRNTVRGLGDEATHVARDRDPASQRAVERGVVSKRSADIPMHGRVPFAVAGGPDRTTSTRLASASTAYRTGTASATPPSV